MARTMRAVVLDAPGSAEALQIRQLPLPEPRDSWVLIKIEAIISTRTVPVPDHRTVRVGTLLSIIRQPGCLAHFLRASNSDGRVGHGQVT
jgi:hypothetical protein